MRSLFTAVFLIIMEAMLFGQTWRRTYGGHASDDASAIHQLADGGYLVVGTTGSFGNGASDIYVLHLDDTGEPIWTKFYGGPGIDVGVDIKPTDNGFILLGQTSNGNIGGYDGRLIHIDPMGNLIWQNDLGTSEWDLVEAIDVHAEYLFVTGMTYGHGCFSGCAFMMKLNMQGDEVWSFITEAGSPSHGRAIIALNDGSAVMAGFATAETGDRDGLILKVDSEGEQVWYQIFGGEQDDGLNDLVNTSSNALVAVGSTRSIGEFENAWLVSIDQAGQENWQRDFGAGTADASLSAVVERNAGGFAVTGYNTLNLNERDMILTILDPEGWFIFGSNYGNGLPADGHDLGETDDGGYVVAGWAEGYGPGIRAAYVVKTDSTLMTTTLNVIPFLDPVSIPSRSFSSFNLFPNPITSGGILNISGSIRPVRTLSLLAISGKAIFDQNCFACKYLKLPLISSGVYSLVIEDDGGFRSIHKLIIE